MEQLCRNFIKNGSRRENKTMTHLAQLTIFDIEENETVEVVQEAPEFNVGNLVKVKKATKDMEVEDYYYIKDFEGQIGTVMEIHKGRSSISYYVDLGNKTGWFREGDLKIV